MRDTGPHKEQAERNTTDARAVRGGGGGGEAEAYGPAGWTGESAPLRNMQDDANDEIHQHSGRYFPLLVSRTATRFISVGWTNGRLSGAEPMVKRSRPVGGWSSSWTSQNADAFVRFRRPRSL